MPLGIPLERAQFVMLVAEKQLLRPHYSTPSMRACMKSRKQAIRAPSAVLR